MTKQHTPSVHITLSAAIIRIEELANEGHTSMKVWRELGRWYTIVNTNVAQNVSRERGNEAIVMKHLSQRKQRVVTIVTISKLGMLNG